MSVKNPAPEPVWWKNTYFWLAGAFLILALVGFLKGDSFIRDPGQKAEGHLWIYYLVASFVALANGYISHKQTVKDWGELKDKSGPTTIEGAATE